MSYKYLLFDLDNTLLDFDASERYALRKVFESIGVEMTSQINEIYHRINKWCWGKFEENQLSIAQLKPLRMELTLKELELEANPIQFSEAYHDYLGETDFFIEGAKELIQDLSKQYNLALITNGIEKVQLARLKNTKLDQYFPIQTISETIGISKPDAGFFEHTFQQLGHPPKEDVLVIGDSLSSDIKGGNNYGVSTCWHNFKGMENTRNIQPTYEIQTISALRQILKN